MNGIEIGGRTSGFGISLTVQSGRVPNIASFLEACAGRYKGGIITEIQRTQFVPGCKRHDEISPR